MIKLMGPLAVGIVAVFIAGKVFVADRPLLP